MKITTTILVVFCTLGFYISEAHAVAMTTTPYCEYSTSNNLPGILEKIELQGDLVNSIGPNAIEAGASKDAIYIQFNQNVGNIDIFIYNENGLQVYYSTVNSSVQQLVVIPISYTTSHAFTVMLCTASSSAEGDFDHN